MKVRWTSESVRLRITPDELAGLERGEVQRQEVTFPGGSGWAVRVEPESAPLGLRWAAGVLLIHLSRSAQRAAARRSLRPPLEGS